MNIDKIHATPSVALSDKVRDLKESGISVIELQIGEPAKLPCNDVVKAGADAILGGMSRYSYTKGLPHLRNAILEEANGNNLDVIITHGAVHGLFSVIAACIEYGDEVIILEPAWSTVRSIVEICGGTPIPVSFLNDSSIHNIVLKSITKKTKAIYVNFPNNPTGVMISQKDFNDIVKIANQFGIYVLSDEVYSHFDFYSVGLPENRFDYDRFVCLNSFSKKYCMTGWRIGYVLSNTSFVTKVAKVSQVSITHVAPFCQQAAYTAITSETAKEHAEKLSSELYSNMIAVNKAIRFNRLEALEAGGAFYKFIKLPTGFCDIEFSDYLLENYRVCVVPGSAYGLSGAGYIRISYAGIIDDVLQGINLISNCCDRIGY
jgi:aspartate/methionine/tyrosine aminotransferase